VSELTEQLGAAPLIRMLQLKHQSKRHLAKLELVKEVCMKELAL
jgi:hypothetical protein